MDTVHQKGSHSVDWLLKPGSVVDQFKITKPIGRGGMGEVYLARDTKLGRKVALKIIRPDKPLSAQWVKRFLHEARATARFNHPHIVTIYAAAEHEGRPYVALEYLEGETLQQRLLDRRLSMREVLRIAVAIAEALREAHANRLLHRDLKPENVVLGTDGRLRVLDFGVAKVFDEDDNSIDIVTRFTEAGFSPFAGTPAYMSPEQWQGEGLSGLADVWAFGAILFEMISGKRPYPQGTIAELAAQVCSDLPAPPLVNDEAPPALIELVGRCLSKQPQGRPTAVEVVEVLGHLLAPLPVAVDAEACPFQGLLSFDERHSGLFFGREEEIAVFIERLRQEPALTVVGASGAGKSSFVQAGVVARLREQRPLQLVKLRPGSQPFLNLARRLLSVEQGGSFVDLLESGASVPPVTAQDASRTTALTSLAEQLRDTPHVLTLRLQRIAEQHNSMVLLFVDQLEELCTLVADVKTRRRFMEAVCSAADDVEAPVRTVFTLREEFLSRLAEERTAREVLGRVMVLRTPGPEGLEQILLRQATTIGYQYDDEDLVRDMVADVLGAPSALSLLQFAGRRLWENRDRGRHLLQRSNYVQMGGVAGALAQHADGVLKGMTKAELQLARSLLLRLLTSEGTRRVVPYQQLMDGLDDPAADVLARLTTARLVTVRRAHSASVTHSTSDVLEEVHAETEVELAHESLAETWGQLRHWLSNAREERRYIMEIEQAASLWHRRGCRDDALWEADVLGDAVRAAARCTTGVPELVTRFISAGQRKQRRAAWRRKGLLAAAFVAIAFVAVGYAIKEHETSEQKEYAERRRAEAYIEAARAALAHDDLLQARAKIRGALEIADSAAARLLWWRISNRSLLWRQTLGTFFFTVAWSPNELHVAAAGQDGLVYLLDARTSQVLRVLRGHTSTMIFGLAFSSNDHLMSAGWDGEIWSWDLRSGQGKRLLKINEGIQDACITKDGRLVVGHRDGSMQVYDLAGSLRIRLSVGSPVLSVACSPNGRWLASGGVGQAVRLWDAATGRQIKKLVGHKGRIRSLVFSANSSLLASGSSDMTARLWAVRDGSSRGVITGHTAEVFALAFTPDGKRLISSGMDDQIRVTSLASNVLEEIFDGHDGAIFGLRASNDSKRIISASNDRTIRLWELGRRRSRRIGSHTKAVFSVAFDPTGRWLASGSKDNTIRIWDVQNGQPTKVFKGHTDSIVGIAYSPNGKLLASGSKDRMVRLWRASDGKLLHTMTGHQAQVNDVTFSPDGKLLASASRDNTVRLWSVSQARPLRVLRGHKYVIRRVDFSPDGKLLASAGLQGLVRIWDVDSGEVRRTLRHDRGAFSAVFGANDKLAVGTVDGKVWLWNLSSGQRRLVGKHDAPVLHLDYDGARQVIGSPSTDRTARLWNLQTGRSTSLVAHTADVNILRFSPDGRTAATASDDGTVRLWHVPDGRPAWHSPLLMSSSLMHATHRGWTSLNQQSKATAGRTGWQRAVSERGRLADDWHGKRLCIGTGDKLEIWKIDADELIWSGSVPQIAQLIAERDGCVVRLRNGHTKRYQQTGKVSELARGVRALTSDDETLMIAVDREVRLLDRASGKVSRRISTDIGVSAMARSDQWIVLGYRDGNIERYDREGKRAGFWFSGVSASAVTALRITPMNTLVAGFGDGLFGIWDIVSGARQGVERLHGRVTHLVARGADVHVGTDLGDHRRWRLSALHVERCRLLCDVWKDVPVRWEAGRPALRKPNKKHPCQPCK